MHYTKHLKLPMNQRANLPHCIAKMHFWTLVNRPSESASVEFDQIMAVNESDICFQHCQSPGSENLLQELDFVNHDMQLHHCMRLLQGFISRIKDNTGYHWNPSFLSSMYSQQLHVWGLTLPFPHWKHPAPVRMGLAVLPEKRPRCSKWSAGKTRWHCQMQKPAEGSTGKWVGRSSRKKDATQTSRCHSHLGLWNYSRISSRLECEF